MRLVKTHEIIAGQTVATDVVNIHGQVILPASTVMEPRHRTLLKAWGIVEISVADNTSIPVTAGPSSTPQTDAVPLPLKTKESLHPALAELAAVAARLGRKSASADETRPPPAIGT